MDSWRRNRSESYNQEGTRTRYQTRKPPLANWNQTVPSWEKKFCWEVGAVPWRKLLETKKYIHMYDNITSWDDSAAGEAFHNAKARYFAHLNRLPCDLPWPDPDAHIDDVDWNAHIDPELILDLGRDDPKKSKESVLIFEDNTNAKSQQGFTNKGWGDEVFTDSEMGKIQEESLRIHADMAAVRENGGGGKYGSGMNKWESRVNKLDNNNGRVNEFGHGVNRFGNNWEGKGYNGNLRESGGRYMSRYKTTRFYGGEQVNNNIWERKNQNGWRREFC